MSLNIKIKRATREQLNTAAAANGLLQGEPYLITDEDRIAVGLSASTYKTFAKESEIGAGATPALDNLASVAINTSLISDADDTDDLGSTVKRWANLFVKTIGATATRVTKGWFTDLEVTNLPTINGGTLASALNLSGTNTGDQILPTRDSLGLDTDDTPTFAGALLSGLTASQLVATDASKNLQSLAVATYPSLTELAYLKGVTSALQTQLDALQPKKVQFGTELTAAADLTRANHAFKTTFFNKSTDADLELQLADWTLGDWFVIVQFGDGKATIVAENTNVKLPDEVVTKDSGQTSYIECYKIDGSDKYFRTINMEEA
jgi:hypothetical protein